MMHKGKKLLLCFDSLNDENGNWRDFCFLRSISLVWRKYDYFKNNVLTHLQVDLLGKLYIIQFLLPRLNFIFMICYLIFLALVCR